MFFLPWCWHTGKTINTLLFYEKTTGIIQSEGYIPPDNNQSPLPKNAASRIGTYTHQAVFKASDGSTQRVFTRVRSNPPPFQIGDEVKIYYDKEIPSKAQIGTFLELWFPTLALGFLTLIFFILWYGSLLESNQ